MNIASPYIDVCVNEFLDEDTYIEENVHEELDDLGVAVEDSDFQSIWSDLVNYYSRNPAVFWVGRDIAVNPCACIFRGFRLIERW